MHLDRSEILFRLPTERIKGYRKFIIRARVEERQWQLRFLVHPDHGEFGMELPMPGDGLLLSEIPEEVNPHMHATVVDLQNFARQRKEILRKSGGAAARVDVQS